MSVPEKPSLNHPLRIILIGEPSYVEIPAIRERQAARKRRELLEARLREIGET